MTRDDAIALLEASFACGSATMSRAYARLTHWPSGAADGSPPAPLTPALSNSDAPG